MSEDADPVTSVRKRSNSFCINFSVLLFPWFPIKQIQPNVTFHISYSHLIYIANQMTGFYEMQHWSEMSKKERNENALK